MIGKERLMRESQSFELVLLPRHLLIGNEIKSVYDLELVSSRIDETLLDNEPDITVFAGLASL